MALIVTQIGLEKAIQADLQGVSFKITAVGVGLNGYVPNKTMTALQNEFKRVVISGGKQIADNHIHFTALFDGADEITGREIGFYLEDGTLFAIDSHPTNILLYKAPTDKSRALEGFDLILDAVPTNSITVDVTGDLVINFDKEFGALQFAPYDAERIYKTGETCCIIVNGEVEMMQMYAGPHLTCINKNPADLKNRHEQWNDSSKPFWWIPYTGTEVGTPFWWLDTTPPESAIMEINANLPTVIYWRLARRYPKLVKGNIINTGEIRGEFLRVLDQGRWIDVGRGINTSQADDFKSHKHTATVGLNSDGSRNILGTILGDCLAVKAGTPTTIIGPSPHIQMVGGNETRPRNIARAMAISI